MRLLLSNDDGCHAPGLTALRGALAKICDDMVTVAPDRNRSGASNSLTLERPLRVNQVAENVYAVDGTPTDCVHLATTGLFEQEADMVVSGINHGANLGDDVLYSGTVAAAMEGRNLGMTAIAVSLVGHRYFETAGRVVASLVGALEQLSLPPRSLLNVNVPDVPWEELRGFRVTRMGYRGPAERPIETRDPRGRLRYWIAPVGENADDAPDTDFAAVAEGYVSITPLQTDLTRHAARDDVQDWLDALT